MHLSQERKTNSQAEPIAHFCSFLLKKLINCLFPKKDLTKKKNRLFIYVARKIKLYLM
jgi:hypothetical protein